MNVYPLSIFSIRHNKSMLESLNKISLFNISPKVHLLFSQISVVNGFCLKIVSYYKKYGLQYRYTFAANQLI